MHHRLVGLAQEEHLKLKFFLRKDGGVHIGCLKDPEKIAGRVGNRGTLSLCGDCLGVFTVPSRIDNKLNCLFNAFSSSSSSFSFSF